MGSEFLQEAVRFCICSALRDFKRKARTDQVRPSVEVGVSPAGLHEDVRGVLLLQRVDLPDLQEHDPDEDRRLKRKKQNKGEQEFRVWAKPENGLILF